MVTQNELYFGTMPAYFFTIIEYKLHEMTAMITNKSPMLKVKENKICSEPCERINNTSIIDKTVPNTWVLFKRSPNMRKEKMAMIRGVVEFTTEALMEVV